MTTFIRSLFSLRHLRMHLAHEGLTARERFGYLLFWALWQTADSVTPVELTAPTKFVLYALAALGIWWAHHKNGGAEGHALIDRYLSVYVIVSLRVTVVVFFALRLLMEVHAATGGLFTAFGYLQYFFQQMDPDAGEDGMGASAFAELVVMAATAYIAWSIGRQIGKVREAAGDAHGLAPVSGMTPAPQPPVSSGYGGWTGRTPQIAETPASSPAPSTTRPLDRFVERVVQAELAERTAKRGPKKAPAKVPARPKRRSTVRLIKARPAGRRR